MASALARLKALLSYFIPLPSTALALDSSDKTISAVPESASASSPGSPLDASPAAEDDTIDKGVPDDVKEYKDDDDSLRRKIEELAQVGFPRPRRHSAEGETRFETRPENDPIARFAGLDRVQLVGLSLSLTSTRGRDLRRHLFGSEFAEAFHQMLTFASCFDNSPPIDEKLIRDSKHIVIFTGAGISTSSGIPDFRGPDGVWTREARGLPPPKMKDFKTIKPTLTHMAIAKLVEDGIVKAVLSQNVDGLHLRSGVPSNQLAEFHGG